MRRPLALCVLVAASIVAASARAGESVSVEAALEEWRVARGRALGDKVKAARTLAATKSAAALKELVAECARHGKNEDKVREQIDLLLAAHFNGPEFAPAIRTALVADLAEPENALLANLVAYAWIVDGRPSTAIDLFLHCDGKPFHQAAILRAFAGAPNDAALALAEETIATLPATEPACSLLLEAAARVVEANVPAGDGAAARALATPIVAHLDDKTTTRRTATVLGRTIARILKSDVVYADAASWRKFMEDRGVAEKLARDGYAPSTTYFAGVPLTGRDLVFVIDTSGSMSEAFTWRPQAPATPSAGPLAGRSADDAEKKRMDDVLRREQDVFKSLNALPWEKIKTRLDAVREALKATLRGLGEDQRFAVVLFAGEARFLNSTRTIVPATRANVEAACEDLDRFGPGGGTNIHRALELAFGASREKNEDPATGTNVDLILRGADTVVLLTDGSPTGDSYDVKGELYAKESNILLAVRRWNLFFDAEVDCVGLADAPEDLLRMLATQGGGQARFLGK